MKLDGYLKIDSIPGSMERGEHAEEMAVHGVEFTMKAPHDPTTLALRGKVEFGPVIFTKYYDKGSPYLKAALFKNTALGDITFSAVRTVEDAVSNYLVIKLKTSSVMYYDMRQSTEDPDLIEERVGFAFHAMEVEYDGDGPGEMSVRAGV